MFAWKGAVPRLTSTVSSQLSTSTTRSTFVRYLSTSEPTRESAQDDVHESQSRSRERSIRKVSEEGGAHSQLVALAVKNTAARQAGLHAGGGGGPVSKEQRLAQAKRQFDRKRSQEPSNSASSGPTPPRVANNKNHHRERSQKGGGGGAGADALALLRGNAQQRPFNPRSNAERSNGTPRPPRRNFPSSPSSSSTSSSSSSPRSPTGPRSKPPSPRRPSKLSTSSSSSSSKSSPFSVEDERPLVPPTRISYPNVNLADLVRADLAAKTLQVKRSVDEAAAAASTTTKVEEGGENSEDPKVREQTRKVLNGDYSQWARGGGGGQGTGESEVALEHAESLLSRNPSVGLKGREVLLNKLKEVL